MNLTDYVTLGRTGLRVSPLCLGSMTFGNDGPGGADTAASTAILRRFVESGGNFIDTADVYCNGRSEEIIGDFIGDTGLRDRVVIATKFGFGTSPGNPNAGGNGRKNIYRALTGSLRRLKTDYIDLYYLHAWDTVTPAEEVISTLSNLVSAGHIRHFGISDAPAWYISRVQTLAEREGLGHVCAIQHEYSLVERTIEYEHIPAAQALGIGLCAWGPLAGGLLSGKYFQSNESAAAGRLRAAPQTWDRFSERNIRIVEQFVALAATMGCAPAELALRWVLDRPGVTCALVGSTNPAQLEQSMRSLSLSLTPSVRETLDTLGQPELVHPYKIFGPKMQFMLSSGTARRAWQSAPVYPDIILPQGNTKSP